MHTLFASRHVSSHNHFAGWGISITVIVWKRWNAYLKSYFLIVSMRLSINPGKWKSMCGGGIKVELGVTFASSPFPSSLSFHPSYFAPTSLSFSPTSLPFACFLLIFCPLLLTLNSSLEITQIMSYADRNALYNILVNCFSCQKFRTPTGCWLKSVEYVKTSNDLYSFIFSKICLFLSISLWSHIWMTPICFRCLKNETRNFKKSNAT